MLSILLGIFLMDSVVYVYKPVGYTPLETVSAYRSQFHIPEHVKLGYAGRLDPMASGVLPVLVGKENIRRSKYERLPKSYSFDVLFGIATDSFDPLGTLQHVNLQAVTQTQVARELQRIVGVWKQEYPPYSAVQVQGKPLYWWARRGRLSEITIPSKIIQIVSAELVSCTEMSADDFVQDVNSRIRLVRGDFRQDEILSQWSQFADAYADMPFPVFSIRVSCSSGVYVRGIAQLFGQRVGVGALALSITRTRVGVHHLSSCIRLDSIRRNG